MKIADNITWKSLQDKVVAVNVTTGVYYTLNPVASEIWQAIAQGRQESEIIASLKENYPDVEEKTLLNDYKEQLAYWVKENIVADI